VLRLGSGNSRIPPHNPQNTFKKKTKMIRLAIALVGISVFTLGPPVYKLRLSQQEPVDFPALASKLDQIELSPEGWTSTETDYEFDDHWRSRLGLHHHRAVTLVSPGGQRLTVLVMLSETGEQFSHTPDICYAAHGCEIQGGVVELPLAGAGKGEVRAVQVAFKSIGGAQVNTAAYGYWVSTKWRCPPKSSIRNQLGREPYLLKVQVLVDNKPVDHEETREVVDTYFDFLASQFAQLQDD
jgi:hypothetical protein